MAKQEEKAVYEPPATQTNLQAFYDREKAVAEAGEDGLDLPQPYQVPSVTRTDLEPRFEVDEEDQRAYVGVDEQYQNYPTDTEVDKPRIPTEGVEAETWKRVLGEVEDHPETDPGEKSDDGTGDEGADPVETHPVETHPVETGGKKAAAKKAAAAPPPPPGE